MITIDSYKYWTYAESLGNSVDAVEHDEDPQTYHNNDEKPVKNKGVSRVSLHVNVAVVVTVALLCVLNGSCCRRMVWLARVRPEWIFVARQVFSAFLVFLLYTEQRLLDTLRLRSFWLDLFFVSVSKSNSSNFNISLSSYCYYVVFFVAFERNGARWEFSKGLLPRHGSFSFAEVEALEMEDCRDEVDEEEADDCTVDVDDVADVDLNQTNCQAYANNDDYINDFADFDLSFLWLLQTDDPEHSFPLYTTAYLLISRNYGKTE